MGHQPCKLQKMRVYYAVIEAKFRALTAKEQSVEKRPLTETQSLIANKTVGGPDHVNFQSCILIKVIEKLVARGK